MNNIHNWVNTALISFLLVAVVILVLVGGNQSDQNLGGTRFPNGISADGTSPIAGQVRGTTLAVTGASTLTGLSTHAAGFVSTASSTVSEFRVSGESFLSLLTYGGATTSSSTVQTSRTLSTADVCNNSLLELFPTVGSITVTMPSATLMIADCIPDIGDVRTMWLFNSTSTNSIVITLADGADTIHLEVEGLTTVFEDNEWVRLTFMNMDGARMMFGVEVFQDGD